LNLNYLLILHLKLPKILEPFVHMKKALDFKEVLFIESFQVLWHKEEILQTGMELAENLYMGRNFKMRILFLNIPNHFYYQWQIQVQIQMDHSFL